jgi:hypothetical protein
MVKMLVVTWSSGFEGAFSARVTGWLNGRRLECSDKDA